MRPARPPTGTRDTPPFRVVSPLAPGEGASPPRAAGGRRRLCREELWGPAGGCRPEVPAQPGVRAPPGPELPLTGSRPPAPPAGPLSQEHLRGWPGPQRSAPVRPSTNLLCHSPPRGLTRVWWAAAGAAAGAQGAGGSPGPRRGRGPGKGRPGPPAAALAWHPRTRASGGLGRTAGVRGGLWPVGGCQSLGSLATRASRGGVCGQHAGSRGSGCPVSPTTLPKGLRRRTAWVLSPGGPVTCGVSCSSQNPMTHPRRWAHRAWLCPRTCLASRGGGLRAHPRASWAASGH